MFDSVEIDGVSYPVELARGIDPASGEPYVGFVVVIDGERKTMQARYNQQLSDDLQALCGLDLEEELITIMKAELEHEIKRYLESM